MDAALVLLSSSLPDASCAVDTACHDRFHQGANVLVLHSSKGEYSLGFDIYISTCCYLATFCLETGCPQIDFCHYQMPLTGPIGVEKEEEEEEEEEGEEGEDEEREGR